MLILGVYSSIIYAEKINFWDQQRKGANNFNHNPTTQEWFEAAHQANIEWVRYAWGGRRNFLMGSSTHYKGLVKKDLEELKRTINYAKKYNIKIVLVPIALPGAQFRQLNNYKNDMRLWKDKKYWHMTAQMWKDLAKEFKDEPTVVGYNIMNEPYPEYGSNVAEQTKVGDAKRFHKWATQHKNTTRDLQSFYQLVIKAIRSIDKKTPILLESGWYSQPNTFVHWKPFQDDKILYQFHMYEPYLFASGLNFRKKLKNVYPGLVKFGENGKRILWNKSNIEKYFSPFYQWIKKHNIPHNRIVAGEFGCMRQNQGCQAYLSDVIEILNAKQFHWAFYSFREDKWGGYNYELGTKGLGWQYWKDEKAGKNPSYPYAKNTNNALWKVIQKGLNE